MGRLMLIGGGIAVLFSSIWIEHWRYEEHPPDLWVVAGVDIIVFVGLVVIGAVLDEVLKKRRTSLEE